MISPATDTCDARQAIPAPFASEARGNNVFSMSRYLLPELNSSFLVWISTLTAGLSPASLGLAYADRLMHLSISLGKITGLLIDAVDIVLNFNPLSSYFGSWREPLCVTQLAKDKRFRKKKWGHFPFNIYQQKYHHQRLATLRIRHCVTPQEPTYTKSKQLTISEGKL